MCRGSNRYFSQCARQIPGSLDHSHALATTTGDCLQQHRPADPIACGHGLGHIVEGLRAWNHRNPGVDHPSASRRLVTHRSDSRRWRSYEDQALLFHEPSELRVLRHEAVARVDGLCTRPMGRLDDHVGLQIALSRRGRPDPDRFARHEHVRGKPIRVRIDRHGANAQILARPNHADGDLTPVGYQDLIEQRDASQRYVAVLSGRVTLPLVL